MAGCKKNMLTSVWSVPHPNAGRNIQLCSLGLTHAILILLFNVQNFRPTFCARSTSPTRLRRQKRNTSSTASVARSMRRVTFSIRIQESWPNAERRTDRLKPVSSNVRIRIEFQNLSDNRLMVIWIVDIFGCNSNWDLNSGLKILFSDAILISDRSAKRLFYN